MSLSISARSLCQRLPGSVRHWRAMSSTSHSLANMQCLVTGASRGIGFEIAARFSALGASCTIVGRNLAALEQAKERLQGHGEGSKDIILRAGDVSKREFWEGLGREMVRFSLQMYNIKIQSHRGKTIQD